MINNIFHESCGYAYSQKKNTKIISTMYLTMLKSSVIVKFVVCLLTKDAHMNMICLKVFHLLSHYVVQFDFDMSHRCFHLIVKLQTLLYFAPYTLIYSTINII